MSTFPGHLHIMKFSTSCNSLLLDTFQLYCVCHIDGMHCMTVPMLGNCCRSHQEYCFSRCVCTNHEILCHYMCQHCLLREEVAATLFSQYNAICNNGWQLLHNGNAILN